MDQLMMKITLVLASATAGWKAPSATYKSGPENVDKPLTWQRLSFKHLQNVVSKPCHGGNYGMYTKYPGHIGTPGLMEHP